MSRKKIKNRLDDLEPEDDHSGGPMVMSLAHFEHEGAHPTLEESPHPELTIKPHPELKPRSLRLAVPNLLAEPWRSERVLMVVSCDDPGEQLHAEAPTSNQTATACELWNALDEDDLEREKEIREENGDPIPDLLAGY